MQGTWKYYVIEILYRIPVEQLGETVGEHRAFLQSGYDRGWLLMSGPQSPRTGGIVIGRAPSRDGIEAFFQDDPYQKKGFADYRFIEFEPVKRQEFLADWMNG